MGREIKFRVWDPETKTMELVGAIDWDCNYLVITCNTETKKLYRGGGNDFVLMQFAGLKDSEGFEIFEGDIVRDAFRNIYEVRFQEDRGGWFPFACDDGCGCCAGETARPENVIIIGNIHENPELLK